MPTLLEQVVAGPCEPRWICNSAENPIPVTGEITVTLTDTITPIILCDDNGQFIRLYVIDDELGVVETDIDFDGNPYVPVGTVRQCSIGDADSVPLCDDGNPFLRNILFDSDGNIIGTSDTELDGVTPYIPSGTVSLCSTPTVIDSVEMLYNPSNLIPNSLGSHQQITVDNTVTTFTGEGGSLHVDTTHVFLRLELGAVRVTFDGTNPVSGNPPTGVGIVYRPNDSMLVRREALLDAKFIALTSSVDGYWEISEWKPL